MDRILVAVDNSDAATVVIGKAIKLCKALQGRIRVLHVEDSAPFSYAPQDPLEPVSGLPNRVDLSQHRDLKKIQDRLVEEGIEADFRELSGPASNNILTAAKEFQADLIVIGGHQHGHFFSMLFRNQDRICDPGSALPDSGSAGQCRPMK